jgi:predicted PurR-regulated permease PerM
MHEYALPIAFIAAILEAIPTLGPVATAVIAIIIAVGSGSSIGTVIFIIVLFYLIQQLESSLVFPQVMAKVVGVDPIVTIVSVIAAYILFGIMGAIFIVPLIAVMRILLGSEINTMVENHMSDTPEEV